MCQSSFTYITYCIPNHSPFTRLFLAGSAVILSSLCKQTTRENHQLILDFFAVFSKNLRGLSTKYREAVEAGLSGADCEFLYDECTTNVAFF